MELHILLNYPSGTAPSNLTVLHQTASKISHANLRQDIFSTFFGDHAPSGTKFTQSSSKTPYQEPVTRHNRNPSQPVTAEALPALPTLPKPYPPYQHHLARKREMLLLEMHQTPRKPALRARPRVPVAQMCDIRPAPKI